MLKRIGMVGMILVATIHSSQGQQGYHLAPGETVIAVDGVPVGQTDRQPTPKTILNSTPMAVPSASVIPSATGKPPWQPTLSSSANGTSMSMQASRSGVPPIIGEGTPAYQHALREAQIIASRGGNYHRHGDGGHPLGTAPGCSYSGTGYTWDRNRPGHCWENELPDNRIVARARAQGVNGAWFWSAHYR